MSVKEYEKLSQEFTEQNILVNQLWVGQTKDKQSEELQAARLKMLDLREKLDEAYAKIGAKENK